MKIPFDISKRPQIESGEYKVETEAGFPAKVMDWEYNNKIFGKCIAIKVTESDGDHSLLYTHEGKRASIFPAEEGCGLFIVTPEPTCMSKFGMKVSEFAEAYELAATDCKSEEYKACDGNLQLIIDKYATELLSLARDQFIKDGYVIEKKAFHDAVENISDKHRAEMSVEYSIHCKVEDGTRHAIMNWEEFQKIAQKFIDIGKAEALKDLPRWYESRGVYEDGWINDKILYYKNHSIQLSSLEKLPGFKEDEK